MRRPGLGRRSLVVGGLVTACLAGVLAWVVLASSLLAVHRVEVSGLHRLSREQVVQASGLRLGTPLARVDLGALRRRVSRLRPVESVRVRRAWPRTLRILVDERVPLAAVPHGSNYALLDSHGVRVATVPKPPDGLPVVRIGGASPVSPAPSGSAAGEASSTGVAARRAALRVLGALPPRLAERVRDVSVERDGGVELRLRGGATVTWGQPRHAREKARILTLLLQQGQGADTYDVSSTEVATTG